MTVFTEHEHPEKYAQLQGFIKEIEQALKLDQSPPDEAPDAVDDGVSEGTTPDIKDTPKLDT